MKKQRYVWLGISMIMLGMAGCTVKDSPTMLTPTPTEKIREVVFQKSEEMVTSEKTITKTDGLCEILEETKNRGTIYNSFHRMLNVEGEDGFLGTGTSLFCIDEKTGVIYFVNQGKDCFLYRMKEGEVALAVAMPVKDIYPYEGSIYFMIDDYDKYELQGIHNGDIYCYTPASGTVELVYATDVIEGFVHGNLYVEESGIYFRYVKDNGTVVEDGKEYRKSKNLDYYLPFGEKEPVEDTKQMVTKGWGDYFFQYSSKWELLRRTPNEDGTRETLEIPELRGVFCVVGDVLYSKEGTKMVCTNLKTGERTEYDFLGGVKKAIGEELLEKTIGSPIDSFVMIEDAFWILLGSSLCRMDLQSGEISVGRIQYNDFSYSITDLYTDGTELYGYGFRTEDWNNSSSKGSVVHLITEKINCFEFDPGIITVESLTE